MKATKSASLEGQKKRNTLALNIVLLIICTAWIIPTLGLLVSSVRSRDSINTSGWWNILPHQAWVKTQSFDAPTGTGDAPITINGVTATFDEFRAGVVTPNGSSGKATAALARFKWRSSAGRWTPTSPPPTTSACWPR
jgi:ABC-type glycerol-3-phosphate transport system permease component